MTQKNLLLTLALLLIAGLGVAVGTGMLGAEDAEVVAWTEADLVTIETPEVAPGEAEATVLDEAGDRLAIEGNAAPVPADDDADRPDIKIHGRVVDGFQRPVAGVQVQLELGRERGGRGGGRQERQQVRRTITTGADGRFAFEGKGFRDLGVTLRLTHQGFAPTFSDHQFRDAAGDLDVGDVRIRLGGAIRGLVTNLDDSPVALATVRVQPMGPNRWNRGPDGQELLPPVQTDGNGQYLLDHLPAGDYRVEAYATRMLRAVSDRIAVDDEMVEEIEPLKLGPGHELRGIVFAPDGRPVANAAVSLEPEERGAPGGSTRTAKDGTFAFDHLTGRAASLRVQADGYLTWHRQGVNPAETSQVTVTLRDGLRLSGEVRDSVTNLPVGRYAVQVRRIGSTGGEDVAARLEATFQETRQQIETLRSQMQALRNDSPDQRQQREAVMRQLATMRDRMRDQEGRLAAAREGSRRRDEMLRGPGRDPGGRGPGGRGPGTRTGPNPQSMPGDPGKVTAHEDGKFSFTGLDEGIYVVDVGSPDHVRLRSQPVELRADQPPAQLTLIVERGLRVRGVVVAAANGEPIAGSDVELLLVNESEPAANGPVAAWAARNRGPRGFPVQRVKTDAKGEFEIEHVAAGRYALRAQARHHASGFTDPFDLAQDVDGTKLALGALAQLSGRVDGIPPDRIAEARVFAFSPGNMRNVDVRPDATYELDDLQPGDWIVRAAVGDLRTALGAEILTLFGGLRGGNGNAQPQLPFDVKLGPGERRTLDLQARVEQSGKVSGVVMKNGLPAKGLRVTLRPQPEPGAAEPPGRRRGDVDMVRSGTRFGGPGGGRLENAFRGSQQQVQTDGHGRFQFERVPIGSYELLVQSSGRGATELHKETLEVRADGETRISVSVLSGSVTGRLRAEAGVEPETLNGNAQLLRGTRERPQDMQAFARQNPVINLQVRRGMFSTSEIPAGEYLLVVNIRGREPAQQVVYVTDGGEAAVELMVGKKR